VIGGDGMTAGSAYGTSEYPDVPIEELMATVDTERRQRALDTEDEVLAAGFLPRPSVVTSPSGSGFESGGVLDTSEPSASLAGLADAVTRDGRLAELFDDELIGVIRAWRRIESWSSAGLMMAIAELARRRPAERTPPASTGAFPAQLSEFIGDEVAAALTLTARTAAGYLDLALDLAVRLPQTAQALRAGVIDYPKARLIAEATRILTDADARAVEARILPRAGDQTLGQLRAAVSRAVLAVDPTAATRRREEAQQDPRVRRWQEDAGTAALAGFGLPPADVLEADQRITTRALALRDAGLTGSLEELRARAYLDTLLGQDSTPSPGSAPSPGSTAGHSPAPGHSPVPGHSPAPGPDSTSSPDSIASQTSGTGQPSDPTPAPPPNAADSNLANSSLGEPAESGQPSPANPGDTVPLGIRPERPATTPRRGLAVRLNLTVPLTTLLGLANEPGNIAGFGPLDPSLTRELAALAANHPASRSCVTITDEDGRAVGHGCARGSSPVLGQFITLGQSPPSRPRAGPFTVTIYPLAQGTCDHRHQEPGYQPSRRLRHLVEARTTTCCAPGCRRPAAQCDLDHTIPYDQGGRTCECDLAPLCRHHHRCKQSEGWRLEQPQPGILRWTTPAGRQYLTQPDASP
jgi:hypothetical protein